MTDIRTRLADTLREYCGADCMVTTDAGYAEYVSDALLSLPGIAIVELPKRELPPAEWDQPEISCRGVFTSGVAAWSDGLITLDDPVEFSRADDARALAAALLAAANAAEADQ